MPSKPDKDHPWRKNIPVKGEPTKRSGRTEQFKEQMRKGAINSGLTPLEFLMMVYRSPKQPLSVRIKAADACLPYVHRKMPTDMTMTDNDPASLAAAVREHIRAAGVTPLPPLEPGPQEDGDGLE